MTASQSGKRVGLTSTIPVEVVYAAGLVPVDLNNAFIASANPLEDIAAAERDGFPRNYCAWMKGIYGALQRLGDIETVIGVVQGDCGNTTALTDLLQSRGLNVIPFAYPADADRENLQREIEGLATRFDVDLAETERAKAELDETRRIGWRVDEMTWKQGTVTGRENHEALVNLSDFGGDPAACAAELSALLAKASDRPPRGDFIRLGLAGVPPIWTDIYERSESVGAGIVYNEVQYEFSMPEAKAGVVEQYSAYTYPYGSVARAAKIAKESARRGLRGLIHYTQSFCYHQLDDAVFRSILDIPVLKLEADMPGPMDARSLVRLEAFVESLS